MLLASWKSSRITAFTSALPTVWNPGQVRNPDGILDTHFTDASAWEFIAARIEGGQPIEIVTVYKPGGATGYVMKIDLEPNRPQLYSKLQLGSGKIIGRSFHYSVKND